ncbi:MAG: hypothetical protein KA178_08175, partial [Alphaproteobacteria bacterium]|nr:hypothetical protein [Alphaproteobacteria bacterium]
MEPIDRGAFLPLDHDQPCAGLDARQPSAVWMPPAFRRWTATGEISALPEPIEQGGAFGAPPAPPS